MMELGSRMKGYYDIYYLSKEFNFNGKILQKAIGETFNNRERVFTIDLLQQVILLNIVYKLEPIWFNHIGSSFTIDWNRIKWYNKYVIQSNTTKEV